MAEGREWQHGMGRGQLQGMGRKQGSEPLCRVASVQGGRWAGWPLC